MVRLRMCASVARQAFWVLALGLLTCFAFFVAVGGLSPVQVAGVSIAMAVLAALWVGHAWLGRVPPPRVTPA